MFTIKDVPGEFYLIYKNGDFFCSIHKRNNLEDIKAHFGIK